MNDVDELKRFAFLHAPGHGIPQERCRELLSRIRNDDRGLPGSWVWEWRRAAELLERRGRLLDACRHYNMARFPYVNGDARRYALERCVSAFNRWRQDNTDIRPLDLDLAGGQVRCWASGLSVSDRKPLLLIMDGIVTIKERWAPLLADVRRLGMAGVVTEMPGVGENALRYDTESWRMLSAVLDRVSGEADVSQTYALTLSFGGHMALRCAMDDPRIRGVITAGAPVSQFFTDAAWHRNLPRLTLDTLAHLTGTTADSVTDRLPDWALTDRQLAALDIPVRYMVNRQDEITPRSDVWRLQRQVRDLRLLEMDDVHGSPQHSAETRLWAALSVLQMRGIRNVRRAAVGSLWRTLRARHLLADSVSAAGT
jgi:esterase FrsA